MIQVPKRAERVAEGSPAAASPQGLADRAKLALIALERTHMPMVVTDPHQPDNPIVLANHAFLKLTGYSADEVVGLNCRFLQGPRTTAADIDIIRAAIAAGAEVTHELVNYRKDGSEFWNQLHISPIFDEDGGLVYHFASQLDVTDRRRARALEAAEHLLLKEVDHRAKNALALVQGIVRLSCADNPEDYARAVQARVDALADAHAMLAEHSWGEVPLRTLLSRGLPSGSVEQVIMAGPDIGLAVAHAQPVALLLHELIRNAVTHGSLSTPAGVLNICWQTEPEAIAIDVVETGGPVPVSAPRRGFGLKMIEAIAVRQLRGKLHLDWRREGLASHIELPRAA
jgi:PAS domain S-box-containing protein